VLIAGEAAVAATRRASTYIALLRAVNVGGNTLKMDRLRQLWSELGFTNIRTYVQSGNVVFEAVQKPAVWLPAVERKLEGETRLPVSVIVRTADEIGRIIATNPFTRDHDVDPKKLHVTFLSSTPSPTAVHTLSAFDTGHDQFLVVRDQIYLHCVGGFADFKLTTKMIEKILSVKATTRNCTTVTRLHQMATASPLASLEEIDLA
jgi:uncharacterized protein (DUF1697 family)